MKICKYCGKEMSNKGTSHELYCKNNPNRKNLSGKNNPHYGKSGANHLTHGAKISEETKSKISKTQTGKKASIEHRKNISEGMKKAHEEGRAWNIGQSRWNNEASYPEKFMMRVFENNNIEYKQEEPCGRFAIDFALNGKLAIEVDGKTHFTDNVVMERDKRKNEKLLEEGWKVLRVKWTNLFNDSKPTINKILEWIENPTEDYLEIY